MTETSQVIQNPVKITIKPMPSDWIRAGEQL